MTQSDLDNPREKYSFPPRIQLRIPEEGETILSACPGEVAFYEAAFPAGLRCLYVLSLLPDVGWYYFKARPDKNLLRGSPSNRKGFLDLEGRQVGKNCNKLPALIENEAKRIVEVLMKIESRGYFEVLKILDSKTLKKYFARGCMEVSSSGRENTTSGDEDLQDSIRDMLPSSTGNFTSTEANALSNRSACTFSLSERNLFQQRRAYRCTSTLSLSSELLYGQPSLVAPSYIWPDFCMYPKASPCALVPLWILQVYSSGIHALALSVSVQRLLSSSILLANITRLMSDNSSSCVDIFPPIDIALQSSFPCSIFCFP
ncbi:hypothetical protein Acr_07g0008500 [Actinidia rufa]|uniref:Uncharacterized protein n=1 Tax=Actinidia rufa TaxID=165716 RepID=A0A7J0EW75_9ERIC|nr:hypothetical protein Acr_07g0008500 [Actinidia rufa]